MAQAEVEVGSSLAPHAALFMPHRCPTVFVVTPRAHVSKKLSLKVDLATPSIASYIVSGQYLSVAMLLLYNYSESCTVPL